MAYRKTSTSKKVHAIEEINILSGKMDEHMKLFAGKSAFSTLIENNNESMDVIFLVGTILVITRIEVILILGCFLVIPVIIMVIPTTTLMEILIRCPLILRIVLNNLRILKRISMLFLKKNCLRLMIWLGMLIEFLFKLIF